MSIEQNKEENSIATTAVSKTGLFHRLSIPPFKTAALEGILILLFSALIAVIITAYTYGLDKAFQAILRLFIPEV